MRCFIALDIEERIIASLAQLQTVLQQQTGQKQKGLKWVNPDRIHLTLKFLGEISDQEVVQVCEAVRATVALFQEFSLEVKHVGVFGRPARVVWAGTDNPPELLILQSEIDKRMIELGFPAENRRYQGHLTLCRIKSTKSARILKSAILPHQDKIFGTSWVDSVCVYKSELTKRGPLYTLLSESYLK